MDVGTPTIDVNVEAITAQILRDPWIYEAVVDVGWPGSIHIEVSERVPIAAVQSGDSWVLVAHDGGVVARTTDPGQDGAAVRVDQGPLAPGDAIDDPATLGALMFLDALAVEHQPGARVTVSEEGLHAVVGGHLIRLGRPVDMAQKALVLAALLEAGIEPGATVNLIAPTRPAVAHPVPEPEVEDGG